MENGTFRRRSQGRIFWKHRFHAIVWTGKTQLFENDDVTHSISHALFQWHLVFKMDYENMIITKLSVTVKKTHIVWTQIFSKTDKKVSVFNNIHLRVKVSKILTLGMISANLCNVWHQCFHLGISILFWSTWFDAFAKYRITLLICHECNVTIFHFTALRNTLLHWWNWVVCFQITTRVFAFGEGDIFVYFAFLTINSSKWLCNIKAITCKRNKEMLRMGCRESLFWNPEINSELREHRAFIS